MTSPEEINDMIRRDNLRAQKTLARLRAIVAEQKPLPQAPIIFEPLALETVTMYLRMLRRLHAAIESDSTPPPASR